MQELLLYFREVAVQVGVMFLMIAVGFFMTRRKYITDRGAKQITDLILYAVTPAVIIKAFLSVEYSPQMWGVCSSRWPVPWRCTPSGWRSGGSRSADWASPAAIFT